jgi:hypothetical protein
MLHKDRLRELVDGQWRSISPPPGTSFARLGRLIGDLGDQTLGRHVQAIANINSQGLSGLQST